MNASEEAAAHLWCELVDDGRSRELISAPIAARSSCKLHFDALPASAIREYAEGVTVMSIKRTGRTGRCLVAARPGCRSTSQGSPSMGQRHDGR